MKPNVAQPGEISGRPGARDSQPSTQSGVALQAQRQPERAALILGDRMLSYRRLDERTTRLALALTALGLGPGDRVAAVLPNGFEFFEVSNAVAKLRGNFIPINWHLKDEELRWILTDSDARAVIADARFAEEVGRATDGIVGCETIWVGAGDGLDYEQALAVVELSAELPTGLPQTPYMFYTSGTTGRPKGAVDESGEGAARQVRALIEAFGLRGDDVHVLAGPAYHAAPGGWVNVYLSLGATNVILPRWDAIEWLSLVHAHRATTAFLVPTHFIRLAELTAEQRARFDVSSLRLILHAGEPCPVPLKARAIEMFPGAEILEYYGGSEAGAATAITTEEWLRHPGSVGRALPGIRIEILDHAGDRLPTGDSGHVYYTPWGRTSYHKDPVKTAHAWRDDVFTVGDIGRMDDEGYLYLTDRRDDMILRAGVNIYPREIENVLIGHPAVADCTVLGVPDSRSGEAVKAIVEPAAPVTVDELRRHCHDQLARFKCPEVFEFVDRIPRDPSGKVRKGVLREAHLRTGA